MDGILRALLAILTAMTSASGSPVDTNASPDRPVIVAPTVAAPIDLVEIKGTVQTINGNTIVVDGVPIVLGASVRVNGDLRVGASVRVVAASGVEGDLQARAISVTDDARTRATPPATAKPTLASAEQPTVKPTQTTVAEPTERPQAKPTAVVVPQPTEKPEVRPTQAPAPEPTEKPEVKPTNPPAPKATLSPESKPNETPEPGPIESN